MAVLAFDVAGGQIKHIWAILNPDKLRSWTAGGHPQADGTAP